MRRMLLMIAAAALASAAATADAHGGRGYPRARVGIHIGAPVVIGSWWASYPAYPRYYYHPYPPPPVVVREVVREPLVFYDERGNPVPPVRTQPQPGTAAPAWFFCQDTQSYYPYVETCASPWQRVIPQPPPPPQ